MNTECLNAANRSICHSQRLAFHRQVALVVLLSTLLMTWTAGPVGAASPPPQEGGRTYTVQAADSLSKLADKYFGNTASWPVIWLATNEKSGEDDSFEPFEAPDGLRIGQNLWIPDAAEANDWMATYASQGVAPSAPVELEGRLIIFHAGSLTVPIKNLTEVFQDSNPGVTFETEASGSNSAARKISQLGREADLMMSADYTVINNLLIPDFADWNIKFARNAMVVAYTNQSLHAEEINAENWYQVLTRDGVIYGHSEPNADPCGYRTLLVWQLAEKHYGVDGLYATLDEHRPPENVRPKEVELIALLESGDMDYAFEYRSLAVQHGLEFVELPGEINLSMIEHAKFYSQAATEVAGKEPGTTMTMVGKPIVYGVTIPRNAPTPELALEFVKFLLGPEGQAIMEAQGQPPIVPPVADDLTSVPDALRSMVAAP